MVELIKIILFFIAGIRAGEEICKFAGVIGIYGDKEET